MADSQQPPDQCTIVGQFLGVNGCCSHGSNDECDQALDAAKIPTLYSSIGWVADCIASESVTEQAFLQAIHAGPLVQMMLDLGSAFHYALAIGFDGSAFQVMDPRYGAGSRPWPEIASGYHLGSLASAWRVHPR